MKPLPELLPALEAAAFDQATAEQLDQLRTAAADAEVAGWIAAELRMMVALHLASAQADDDLHQRVLRLIAGGQPGRRSQVADEVVRHLGGKRPVGRRLLAWWPVAAAASLLVALAAAWWSSDPRADMPVIAGPSGVAVAVAPGARLAPTAPLRLVWSDASQLLARPGAELVVDERGVVLVERGEVEARIAKRDPRHRFSIDTPQVRIEVVGTVFNVDVRAGGTRIRVDEGRVRIANDHGQVEAIPYQVVWCAAGQPPAVDAYLSHESRIASEIPGFLGADGTSLRDRNGAGAVVTLRGVKLSGWLQWEGWMSPIDRSRTVPSLNNTGNGYDAEARALLARRFSDEQAQELMTIYKDHWITARDLDLIQAQGFNAVRLPIGYDHLLDAQGRWRSDAFRHLDWLIAEAWKRGMWTIICLQGYLPPAAHQDGSATGYWNNLAMQMETARIWSAIAARYRSDQAVAMYDLIDQPINSTPAGGRTPDPATVCDLYDRLYRAIRAVDPYHLVAMQGMWDWRTLRDPMAAGYRNVVYSFHWFNLQDTTTPQHLAATTADLAGVRAMWERWQVPVLVGECNHAGDPDAWRDALRRYDEAGLSWCMAGWKHRSDRPEGWALLGTRPGASLPVPDLARDPAADIGAAWTAWETTERDFVLSPLLQPVIQSVLNPKP